MRHNVVLIPGDGIGPEVTEAMTRILSAAGADIDWVQRQAGLAALLPPKTQNSGNTVIEQSGDG